MSDNSKAWLQQLHSDPMFQQVIAKRLNELRPTIPNWNPKEDNSDLWREKSAQQAGFDLALTVLALKADKT